MCVGVAEENRETNYCVFMWCRIFFLASSNSTNERANAKRKLPQLKQSKMARAPADITATYCGLPGVFGFFLEIIPVKLPLDLSLSLRMCFSVHLNSLLTLRFSVSNKKNILY